MNLLIKPASHQCNLACGYCFYRRVSAMYPAAVAIMTEATARALIEKALGSGARKVSFCWQGGEPTLMGLEFYRMVVRLQREFRRPGQSVENVLQTNGLLLDVDWARFLKEENFLVGLSLDGPAGVHDRYRVRPGGGGTFDQTMEAAALLARADVPFNILVLLNSANVDRPDDLYSFFKSQGFDHLQFIPCLEHGPDGRSRDYSIDAARLARFETRLFDLWLEDGFPRVSIRLFEDVLMYLLDGIKASCGWLPACDSYLVVEHNGDCYPCDFYVRPEWLLGNLHRDELDKIINSPLRLEFARRKSDLPVRCRNCRHVNFCVGDCQKFRAPGKASLLCEARRMLLDHIMDHPDDVVGMARAARREYAENLEKQTARNDPCPCGSGRKYKKCCLNRGPA